VRIFNHKSSTKSLEKYTGVFDHTFTGGEKMNLFNLALVPSVAVTVLFIFISGLIIWKYSEKEKGNKKEFTQYMINSAYYGLVVVYLMSFAYEAFGNSVTRESMSALMANTSSTPANNTEDIEQKNFIFKSFV
jgi:hypothetical protein